MAVTIWRWPRPQTGGVIIIPPLLPVKRKKKKSPPCERAAVASPKGLEPKMDGFFKFFKRGNLRQSNHQIRSHYSYFSSGCLCVSTVIAEQLGPINARICSLIPGHRLLVKNILCLCALITGRPRVMDGVTKQPLSSEGHSYLHSPNRDKSRQFTKLTPSTMTRLWGCQPRSPHLYCLLGASPQLYFVNHLIVSLDLPKCLIRPSPHFRTSAAI